MELHYAENASGRQTLLICLLPEILSELDLAVRRLLRPSGASGGRVGPPDPGSGGFRAGKRVWSAGLSGRVAEGQKMGILAILAKNPKNGPGTPHS